MPNNEFVFGMDFTKVLNQVKKQEKAMKEADTVGKRIDLATQVRIRQGQVLAAMARQAGAGLPPLVNPNAWSSVGLPGNSVTPFSVTAPRGASPAGPYSKPIGPMPAPSAMEEFTKKLSGAGGALSKFAGVAAVTTALLAVTRGAAAASGAYMRGGENANALLGDAEIKASQMQRHLGINAQLGKKMLLQSSNTAGANQFFSTALQMSGSQRIQIPQDVLVAGAQAITNGEDPAIVTQWLQTGQWALIKNAGTTGPNAPRSSAAWNSPQATEEIKRRQGGAAALAYTAEKYGTRDARNKAALKPAMDAATAGSAPLSFFKVLEELDPTNVSTLFKNTIINNSDLNAQEWAAGPYSPGQRDPGIGGRTPVRQPNTDLQSGGRGTIDVNIVRDNSRKPNTRVGNGTEQ